MRGHESSSDVLFPARCNFVEAVHELGLVDISLYQVVEVTSVQEVRRLGKVVVVVPMDGVKSDAHVVL